MFVCFSLSWSQPFWLSRSSLENTGGDGLPGRGDSLGKGQRCDRARHILGMVWGLVRGWEVGEGGVRWSRRGMLRPEGIWNTHPCRAWSRPWRKPFLCLSRPSLCWSLWCEHVLEIQNQKPQLARAVGSWVISLSDLKLWSAKRWVGQEENIRTFIYISILTDTLEVPILGSIIYSSQAMETT